MRLGRSPSDFLASVASGRGAVRATSDAPTNLPHSNNGAARLANGNDADDS